MKCLLWFVAKKDKDAKLYLKVKGSKEQVCNVLDGISETLDIEIK